MDEIKVVAIAKICYQANKAYCELLGDYSQEDWQLAPDYARLSSVKGVKYQIANPNSTPESLHQEWCRKKELAGWKYGPIKDVDKKVHPCLVSYDKLPETQRFKDQLFRNIVMAFL